MYSIYFYNDWYMKRIGSQYGYWTGKSYTYGTELFPVCATSDNKLPIKWYKSLKRAITGAEKAMDKFGYVTGYDIEDDAGDIAYRSYNSTDVIDNSGENSYTPKEIVEVPIIKADYTISEKVEMMISKYQSQLDSLEVLTEFTFEDGKREVLESVIADLHSIME